MSRIHKIRSNALPLQDGWESRLSWIVDVREPTAFFCTQKVKLICGLILFITQEQFHLIITFGHRHSRNNFYWFKAGQTIYELLFVQSSQNNTKEIIAQQFHAPVDWTSLTGNEECSLYGTPWIENLPLVLLVMRFLPVFGRLQGSLLCFLSAAV